MRIWPEPARRVGDTAYKQKPTQVILHKLTLQQLIRFLHTLTGPDTGLHVASLRLTTPRGHDTTNIWNAETTITYLIYAPIEPSVSL